jgi:hypothetical protein
MLDTLSVAFAQVTRITGQYLAKNRLGKRDRAVLAARIISGAVEIDHLTHKQIELCAASRSLPSRSCAMAAASLVRSMPTAPLAVASSSATDAERTDLCCKFESDVWVALERATDAPVARRQGGALTAAAN